MAISVILDGLALDRVTVHVDPLAELGFMLHAVTHGDHHQRGRQLRDRLYEQRNDELLSLAKHFRPLYGAIRARYLLPLTLRQPARTDLDSHIAALAELATETFVRHSALSLIEFSQDVDLRSITTDRQAKQALLRRVERLSISRLELAADIVERPRQTLDRLRDFLMAAGKEWFEPEWAEHSVWLATAARLCEAGLRTTGLGSLADLTATAVIADDPLRVTFDKVNKATVKAGGPGLVLVPSYYISPHLVIKHDAGFPVVIAFDVGPASGDGLDLTLKRIAALNDTVRMEICRAVLRTPRTTIDLAYKMRMTQPQMSRHLRVLREARLVSAERHGRFVYYALDSRAILGMGGQLLSLLHR